MSLNKLQLKIRTLEYCTEELSLLYDSNCCLIVKYIFGFVIILLCLKKLNANNNVCYQIITITLYESVNYSCYQHYVINIGARALMYCNTKRSLLELRVWSSVLIFSNQCLWYLIYSSACFDISEDIRYKPSSCCTSFLLYCVPLVFILLLLSSNLISGSDHVLKNFYRVYRCLSG